MSPKDREQKDRLNRRDFLKLGTAGAAFAGAMGASCSGGGSSPSGGTAAAGGESTSLTCPQRKLGKTHMTASTIAMGGGSALSMVTSDDEAIELIDLARRKGINYFDTGSEYGQGESEKRFGMALAPYRKEVYLSTKYSPGSSPDELMAAFERSLERFKTDYLDNANMHGLAKTEDVDLMFNSGALETLVKLKEQGLIKNIGITSHNSPSALEAAMKRFQFDIVLAAANASGVPFVSEFESGRDENFESKVLPLANEQGVGLWAFKITGQRRLIQKNNEPNKAPGDVLLRYGFSLPVHGIVLGMHTREHILSAVEMACNYEPMTTAEMREWNKKLSPAANELTYLDHNYVDDGMPRAHLA